MKHFVFKLPEYFLKTVSWPFKIIMQYFKVHAEKFFRLKSLANQFPASCKSTSNYGERETQFEFKVLRVPLGGRGEEVRQPRRNITSRSVFITPVG